MTIWINEDLEALDVVIERGTEGVATVLADSVDHLLGILSLCPEEPFRTTGGQFPIGVHVPIHSLKISQHSKMLEKENAEFLSHDVSPAPTMLRWVALRPTQVDVEPSIEDEQDGSDIWYQNGNGYIWPQDTDEILTCLQSDGWKHIALVPCFFAPVGLEFAESIAGVIDSFTLTTEEADFPPNLDDIFGGDA